MVFTIPRTASHLLLKLLNLPEQSSVHRHSNGTDGYIFFPAAAPRFKYSLPGKPVQEWTDEQKSALQNALQKSFDDWTNLIQEAEKLGKSTFVKEHLHWMADPLAEAPLYKHQDDQPPTPSLFQVRWDSSQGLQPNNKYNVTCIPDAFLLQHIKPTFLIRHPALAFPSGLRTAIDNQGIDQVIKEHDIHKWESMYYWSLSLHTFYSQAANFDRKTHVDGVEYPIVLDAQDLGNEALVKTYARAVGLDEDKVQFAWKAAGEEELGGMSKAAKRMKSTILASSGIEKGKLEAETLDIENLKEEWRNEFGEILSERLVKLVDGGMDAYERLKSVRLRV